MNISSWTRTSSSHWRFVGAATLLFMLGATLGACQRTAEQPSRVPDTQVNLAVSDNVVTVTALTLGDRACYLETETAAGEQPEIFLAAYEICEQVELVGNQVRIFLEPSQIQALSCQGNPECLDYEPVNLVIAAKIVN